MWNAITYVGSGFTLVAFIAALAAWIIKTQSEQKERLIRSAPEKERGILVQNALEFLRIETGDLTRAQQYDLAIKQIHQRSSRFSVTSLLIFLLSVIAATLTAFAIYQFRSEPPSDPGFDAKIDSVNFFSASGRKSVEIPIHFFPTGSDPDIHSTVFTGVLVAYDQDKHLQKDRKLEGGPRTCKEVPSCLTAHVFNEFEASPTIIRGFDFGSGSKGGAIHTVVLDVPATTTLLKLEGQFYQREARGGGRCVVDDKRSRPVDAVPFLVVVDRAGRATDKSCIGARFSKIVQIDAPEDSAAR